MDLSLTGTFLYFLMVVVLFTSPITIGLIVVGFFKGFSLRALGGIAIALPLLAVILQFTFHLQDELESRGYQQQDSELDRLFGTMSRSQLIDGHLVGFKEVYDYNYARYQFVLSGFSPMALDILVPPTNVTSGVTITLAQPIAPLEVAHLIILDDSTSYGALRGSPAAFLGENFPTLTTGLKSERLLLLRLSARQSQLTYYSGENDKYPWRNQSAFLQWESFAAH